MALTPEDVHNKEFHTAFRGYNEEEVDSFLDEVEAELSRLQENAANLRQQLELSQAAAAASTTNEAEEVLRRTLLIAQRTADATVAEAQRDAARTLDDARRQAAALTADARRQAEALTSESRREAEQLAEESRQQATRLVDDARRQASELTSAAQERAATELDELERRRADLEKQVARLRTFEREYRNRMKAYLQAQLRELDASPDAGPPATAAPATGVRESSQRREVAATPGVSAIGEDGDDAPVPRLSP